MIETLGRRAGLARLLRPWFSRGLEGTMNAAKLLPGKFVWFEHASRDAKKAQAFYGEVFGWKVSSFPISEGSYDMIAAGDAMIGGYDVRRVREGEPAHWRSVMSVANVDATA